MLPLLRTVSLRYLQRRWTRAVLIVVSIALGVATLVATRALHQTLAHTAEGAVTPFAAGSDLIVVNGQAGIPVEMADELRSAHLPGVAGVWPLVFGRVLVPELSEVPGRTNPSVLLIGVPLSAEGASSEAPPGVDITWTASPGDWLRLTLLRRKPAVVGNDLARDLAKRPGGESAPFRARLCGQDIALASVGRVQLQGEAAVLGTDTLFLRREDAGKLIYPLRPNFVTRINLLLEPGTDPIEVRRRAKEVVGNRGEVLTGTDLNITVSDITAGLELGTDLLGGMALLIGLFLVYNTLSVSVAERRHEIGILRSTGATRSQIVRMFVTEAMLLGLTGSGIGLPLGLGLAKGALAFLAVMFNDIFGLPLESQALRLAPLTMFLAVTAGTGTAVLAALVPALRASREDPADAVRRVPPVVGRGPLMVRLAVCVFLLAAAAGCVAGSDQLPQRWGSFAGMSCLIVTMLVATPVVVGVFGWLARPLFRRVFGPAERLAADNLVRSPGRTGLVVAALAATGSLLVMTAGFIHSTEEALVAWLDEEIAADLFVTAGGSFEKPGQAVPMSEELGLKLRQLPGIDVALPVRGQIVGFRGKIVVILALDAHAFEQAKGAHRLARNLGRFPELKEPGTALVSENFAALYGVRRGEKLTVRGPHGPLELDVIGAVPDYSWNRGTIIVDRQWYRDRFIDDQVDIFDVFLRPGVDPEDMRQELQKWGAADALAVGTRAELRGQISSLLHKTYSLGYALEVVVGLVALLGVTSALFISVLQRQRELGLLRAVGASQGQVLRTVLAEAALMGLLGGAIGFGAGLMLEWYALQVLIPHDAGWVFAFRVPWRASGLVIGLTLVLATLAGLAPALQAMRLRIAEAIAHE